MAHKRYYANVSLACAADTNFYVFMPQLLTISRSHRVCFRRCRRARVRSDYALGNRYLHAKSAENTANNDRNRTKIWRLHDAGARIRIDPSANNNLKLGHSRKALT